MHHECLNLEAISTNGNTPILTGAEVFDKIRTLNLKQRQMLNFLYSWAKSLVKFNSAKGMSQTIPYSLLISGEGDCRKSH